MRVLLCGTAPTYGHPVDICTMRLAYAGRDRGKTIDDADKSDYDLPLYR
jgi:hypothetical protein